MYKNGQFIEVFPSSFYSSVVKETKSPSNYSLFLRFKTSQDPIIVMPPPLDQIFPPCPGFTEKDASDQSGRVFLVTGSTSGIGLELAKMLYGLNGTVYVAGRAVQKINAAIETIRSQIQTRNGRIEALQIDLENLSSVGESARSFLSREDRLDVLVHNAGLMTPPSGSKTSLVSRFLRTIVISFSQLKNLATTMIPTIADIAMIGA